MKDIDQFVTPALLLDRGRMRRNLRRLSEHMDALGGMLRPHVKTAKSIDVFREVEAAGNVQGITVSTLKEAGYFFEQGVTDILYAIGIVPNKFASVATLADRGCNIKVILDSEAMATALAADGAGREKPFKVLVELDTDGHRSGVDPKGDELLRIAAILADSPGTELLGVMTHAGESYNCRDPECLVAIARQERSLSVLAAERLRAAGHECPVVSVGSTPTAFSIDALDSVTEVRAGVYVFFDLVMAGIGVCSRDDIALSVLTSVIGHQHDKGWVLTDAGWMAMSRDRGTATQAIDYGYGAVVGPGHEDIGDLVVSGANQEHGIVTSRTDETGLCNRLPLGSLLRVLPNHACSTAAQFDRYHVIDDNRVVAEWPRISGW